MEPLNNETSHFVHYREVVLFDMWPKINRGLKLNGVIAERSRGDLIGGALVPLYSGGTKIKVLFRGYTGYTS